MTMRDKNDKIHEVSKREQIFGRTQEGCDKRTTLFGRFNGRL